MAGTLYSERRLCFRHWFCAGNVVHQHINAVLTLDPGDVLEELDIGAFHKYDQVSAVGQLIG